MSVKQSVRIGMLWMLGLGALAVVAVLLASDAFSPSDPTGTSADPSSVPGLASGKWQVPLTDEQVLRLRHWLMCSYVENGPYAAFGEYPGENLDVPSLHQTRAAVCILQSDVPAQPLPPIGTTWIDSLQTPDGLYDDPATDAPTALETYWALNILAALGVEPRDPAACRRGVLGAMPPIDALDASRPATDLLQALGQVSMCVMCLEVLPGPTALEQDAALEPLRSALERIVSAWELAAGPQSTWSADDFVAPLAARLLAQVSGAATPPQARALLAELLTREADYAADLVAEADFLALVTASGRALGWTETPAAVRQEVASYLQRTEPADESCQGYGQQIKGWAWVDPAPNVCRTQLYALARQHNPVLPAVLSTMDRLRCPEGWSAHVCAIPNPDWTYFCTAIARAIGITGIDWQKVGAYARDGLSKPGQGRAEFLASVRTLACLGILEDADRAAALAFVEQSCTGPSPDIAYASALLDAIGASPSDAVQDRLLARAIERLADVEALRPGALAELARLHRLLGEKSVPTEPIRAAIGRLAMPSGGFRIGPDAPAADLMSTYHAVCAYASIDRLDSIDADSVRTYVLSCWSLYGFQLARPEDVELLKATSEPYLASTWMAFSILSRLASAPGWP